MPLHQQSEPLTDDDLKTYKLELANLQGNILRGHGRDYTAHIFLAFRKGKQDEVTHWLSKLAGQVTSMTTQRSEQREYSKHNVPGHAFRSVYLSAAGYIYLGYDIGKFDRSFQAGMKKARARLGDPRVEKWEEPYRGVIHAMFLIADDGEAYISRCARELFDEIDEFAKVLTVELGAAYRNQNDKTIEHFGYVDGASQPIMLEEELKDVIDKEKVNETGKLKRFAKWHPGAGPNLVLVRDPYGGRNAHGSYFVFRKLEQNVLGFKLREKELALSLELTGPDRELAGAMVVGRFESGNPVLLDEDGALPQGSVVRNDFNYQSDPLGNKCPLHGHIRKVNPRGSSVKEKMGRIARRGITYGVRTDESFENEELMPIKDVGLLFMCYQRDLASQFEHMQQKMANSSSFPRSRTGIDPVIGKGGKGGQRWSKGWGKADPEPERFDFSGFVTMKGGEYFFAPSIPFLRGLAGSL